MQFSDLYGKQLDIELGSADRTTLFTTARRQKAVNDAMHNFERITFCTPVYGSIAIISTTAEYDLLNSFSNFISFDEKQAPAIKRVASSGVVTWIQGDDFLQRSAPWLDRDEPGWRADTASTPAFWYIRDDAGTTFLGMDPAPLVPVGDVWTLLVPYLATSTDMVADTDLPFIVNGKSFARLAPYHQGLVHYAAGLLEPLRKNYDAQKYQMSLYSGFVQQYLGAMRRNGPDQVTFARKYYREHGRPNRNLDPHRFP